LTIDNGQLTTTTHENYYLDRNQIAFVTDGGGNETFHYLYGLNVDQVLAQDSPTGMWSLEEGWNSGVNFVQQGWNNAGQAVVNGATSFRNTVTSNAQSGLEYWANVVVAASSTYRQV
jgi:hypothetical protein